MCKDCLKERYPDRGTTCLEAGSYLVNYAGCSQCKVLGFVLETNRVRQEESNEEEEEEEEIITYDHKCQECGHLIAKHEYIFRVDEEFQDYTMECELCGRGQASISVLPDDPREKPLP